MERIGLSGPNWQGLPVRSECRDLPCTADGPRLASVAMTSGSSGDHPGARTRLWWPWATAAAGLATALWAVSALLMADHGFDVSDEGFYVLSYRWWDSTPRVFTGVQYVYGPLFELLGWSIPGLRVARLVSILLVHAGFGWAFMCWLRLRRPSAPATRGWEVAGTTVIVASAGVTYGWLPLSPGYNDVAAVSATVLCGLVLLALGRGTTSTRLPIAPALLMGPPVLGLVLSRWTSALALVPLVVGLGALAFHAHHRRGQLAFWGAALAGTVVSGLLFHVLVLPLDDVFEPILEVNRASAAYTHHPGELLVHYAREGISVASQALLLLVTGSVVAALSLLGLRRRPPRLWLPPLALAPVLTIALLMLALTPSSLAGSAGLRFYPPVFLALLMSVGLAVWVERGCPLASTVQRLWRQPELGVYLLLLLAPLVQGAGSSNGLTDIAVNSLPCWTAIMVGGVASTRSRPALVPCVSAITCTVVLSTAVACVGLLRDPYRTSGFAGSTSRVDGAGVLVGLELSRQEGRLVRGVRSATGHDGADRVSVISFAELGGLVLALDGQPVGESWNSSRAAQRGVVAIEEECRHIDQFRAWPPIILFEAEPTAIDLRALRSCGLSLDDYARADFSDSRGPILVYTPVGSGKASTSGG